MCSNSSRCRKLTFRPSWRKCPLRTSRRGSQRLSRNGLTKVKQSPSQSNSNSGSPQIFSKALTPPSFTYSSVAESRPSDNFPEDDSLALDWSPTYLSEKSIPHVTAKPFITYQEKFFEECTSWLIARVLARAWLVGESTMILSPGLDQLLNLSSFSFHVYSFWFLALGNSLGWDYDFCSYFV